MKLGEFSGLLFLIFSCGDVGGWFFFGGLLIGGCGDGDGEFDGVDRIDGFVCFGFDGIVMGIGIILFFFGILMVKFFLMYGFFCFCFLFFFGL